MRIPPRRRLPQQKAGRPLPGKPALASGNLGTLGNDIPLHEAAVRDCVRRSAAPSAVRVSVKASRRQMWLARREIQQARPWILPRGNGIEPRDRQIGPALEHDVERLYVAKVNRPAAAA